MIRITLWPAFRTLIATKLWELVLDSVVINSTIERVDVAEIRIETRIAEKAANALA